MPTHREAARSTIAHPQPARDAFAGRAASGASTIRSAAGNQAFTRVVQRAGPAEAARKAEKGLGKGKRTLDVADNLAKLTKPTVSHPQEVLSKSAPISLDGVAVLTDVVGAVKNWVGFAQSQHELHRHGELDAPTEQKLRRDRSTKGADAAVDTGNLTANALSVTKAAVKTAGHGVAAVDATAGGLAVAVAAAKALRDIRSAIRTWRTRGALQEVPLPTEFAQTQQAQDRARKLGERAAKVRELETAREPGDRSDPEAVSAIGRLEAEIETLVAQISELEATVARQADALPIDQTALTEVRDYAVKKRGRRFWKKGASAVGNSVKVASGAVAIAIATGAIAATNPAGWALTLTAALIVGGLAGYKAVKSVRKKYKLARAENQSELSALGTALAFWQEGAGGKRKRMANQLYDLATDAEHAEEIRLAARELLKALNIGPKGEDGWDAYLTSGKKSLVSLIEKKLAS